MNKEAEYKKIFIQESDELLQQMNQSLLELENNNKSENALNAIFRSAHTLKSMSASMGYKKISELAHKMEDVLAQVRSEELEVSEDLINLLFRSFDALESMVEAVQGGKHKAHNADPLISELNSKLKKEFKVEDEKVNDELYLNKFEKRTLARVVKDKYSCFHVKVWLESSCALKSVRAFMVIRNLHKVGEVIKSFPDVNAINEESFGDQFGLVFITKEGRDAVVNKAYEILEVKSVVVDKIDVDKSWEAEKELGSDDEPETYLETAEHIRKIRSIRIDVERLDKLMNLVEELAITKLKLYDLSGRLNDVDLKGVIEEISRLTDELQEEVMQSRLVPVGQVFDRFPRMVRDLAKNENKSIKFTVLGSDIELDRVALDEIAEPMIHLLRNAVDHGIEASEAREKTGKPSQGSITLTTKREKDRVVIEVRDDGGGIDVSKIKAAVAAGGSVSTEKLETMSDEEVILLAAKPGISTKTKVTEVSGRGVGLDVVKEKTEEIGGNIRFKTKLGVGTSISISLPQAAALVKALLVNSKDIDSAIPLSSIIEIDFPKTSFSLNL